MGHSKQFFPECWFPGLRKALAEPISAWKKEGKIQRAWLCIPTRQNLQQLILVVALQTDLYVQNQELVSERLLSARFDLYLHARFLAANAPPKETA